LLFQEDIGHAKLPSERLPPVGYVDAKKKDAERIFQGLVGCGFIPFDFTLGDTIGGFGSSIVIVDASLKYAWDAGCSEYFLSTCQQTSH